MVDFTKIVKKSIKDEKVDKKEAPATVIPPKKTPEISQDRPLDHIFGKKEVKKNKKKIKYSENLGELFGVEEPENE